jgi:hypothetical protein
MYIYGFLQNFLTFKEISGKMGERGRVDPTSKRKEVNEMATIVKGTILLLESEVKPLCPANKN